MSKQKKAMPWDELRVCDDDPANVTFEIVFHNENDSYVSEIYGVGKGETVDEVALAVCRRFGWDKQRPGAAKWETLCKRTDYPKLGYIIYRLKQAGIPCQFETDENGRQIGSFHASNILQVASERSDDAWEIMGEKWSKSRGVASNRGRTSLDDMPDDHPAFRGYMDERPGDDDEGGEHDFDPIRDGWIGSDGRP